MAFTLQRDIAFFNQLPVFFHRRIMIGDIAPAYLWLVISQHSVSFHQVMDHRIPKNNKLCGHPLVTVVGFGIGIDTMRGKQFTVHHHIGTWGTKVACRPVVGAVSAQELSFYGYGKVLILGHAFRGLTMEHGTAVWESPTFATGGLLTHKTVFESQLISRKWIFVKNMPIPLVEILVAIITHLHDPIFHTEGVAKVIIQLMLGNFNRPVVQILSVK